jgi:hypothetical protein
MSIAVGKGRASLEQPPSCHAKPVSYGESPDLEFLGNGSFKYLESNEVWFMRLVLWLIPNWSDRWLLWPNLVKLVHRTCQGLHEITAIKCSARQVFGLVGTVLFLSIRVVIPKDLINCTTTTRAIVKRLLDRTLFMADSVPRTL